MTKCGILLILGKPQCPQCSERSEDEKMKDQYKTKTQLIEELEMLRKQVVKLKKVETKRKRAEEALRKSEERLRLAQSTAHVGVWEWDPNEQTLEWTPGLDALYGLKPGTVHSYRDWSKLVHPEDLPRIEAKRDEAIVHRLPFELEFRILQASGDTRWLQARGGAIYDKDENPSRVLGINIDITERKKAEELLTRRAKEIAALQKTLLEITSSQDLSLLLQNIVIRAAELLNANGGGLYLCEPERREVRCVVSYNTPHDYVGTVLKYGEGAAGMVAETGQPLLIDDYRTWGQRATIYEKESPFSAVLSVPMTWGKEVIGVIHVLDNVETRHFMESDLQLLEMFASHAAITVRNARLFEQAQKEITERMRVEEELRKRGKEITFIAENVPALFSYLDGNGCYRFINKRYEEWFNIPRAQIIGKHYKEVLGESVSEQIKGFVEAALRGEEVNYEAPLPYLHGGLRWVSAKYVPSIDDQGKLIGFFGLVTDITERKHMEETLSKSKEKFGELFDNAPVGYFEYDKQGRISNVNRTEAEMLGYTFEEMVGQPVWKFIVEEKVARNQILSKLTGTMSPARGLERTYRRKDGTTFPALIEDRILKDSDGKIVGIRCTIQDITKNKQVERERKDLFEQVRTSRERLRRLSHRLVEVQETERRDLVRKLHDEVGQDLTALSLNLNIVQSLVRSLLPVKMGTKLTNRMNDSLDLVEKTIERIRDLMVELRPPVLDDYGLTAALHWYGKQFSERTGIVPVIELEELIPRLPLPLETGFFRIAQEALTNVSKYAKAKQFVLSLDEVNGEVQLSIADDGIGFDAQNHQEPGAKPEWGLINMRERAQALGGDLFVETAPGKGTKIIVEVRRNH